MADETTYDSEINQPNHRPGMESVVSRGDARDQSGSRTGERPTVGAGHTDPFSVKGDPSPKAIAKPATATDSDPSGVGGREREATIMSQVKAAGG